MPDPNTIGGVNFEITATGAPQAQAAIKETARVAEEAAAGTDAGGASPIDNAGKATGILARAGELASTLAGHMGLVVSTASTFYIVGTKIREGIVAALEAGIERAKQFRDALDLSDVKTSHDKTAKKLEEINALIAAGLESYGAQNGEVSKETLELEKQAKETEKLLVTLQKTLNAREGGSQKDKKRKEEEAQEREDEARHEKAMFDLLLKQNEERFSDETADKARKKREQDDAEEKRRREEEAYELAEYEAKLRDKARAEQEAKDRASLQRRAAEARASFRATLADAANAAVGNEIVYSLSKIGGALESIRSQTASRDLSNGGGFE